MAKQFHPKVSLISINGDHVRYVPGPLAEALVRGGNATVVAGGGKVRSVTLAPMRAVRIGDPNPNPNLSVRFTRWVVLEKSACRIVEHHPRCLF